MAKKKAPAKAAKKPPKKRAKLDKLAPRKTLAVAATAEQIDRLRGNLSAVGRHFKVSRQAVQDFAKAHPELLAVIADAREGRLDAAEDALDAAVERGEGWAVCFTLKTLGKARGYVERQELAVSGPPFKVYAGFDPEKV